MADLFAQAGSQPASTFRIGQNAAAGRPKRADAQSATAEDDLTSSDQRGQIGWDSCLSSEMGSEYQYGHATGASDPLLGLVENARRASDSGLIDLHLGSYLRSTKSKVRSNITNGPHSGDEITHIDSNRLSTPSLLLEDPNPTLEPSSPVSETSSISYASSSSSASWTGDDEFIPRRRDRLPHAKTAVLTLSDSNQDDLLPSPVITATASHPAQLQRKDSQQSPLDASPVAIDAAVVIVDGEEHNTLKEVWSKNRAALMQRKS
nr:hypothetical protein CFP56_20498 [Quercus suber]